MYFVLLKHVIRVFLHYTAFVTHFGHILHAFLHVLSGHSMALGKINVVVLMKDEVYFEF